MVHPGIRQTPEMISGAALQEDVDVTGLRVLSGAHMTLFPKIMKLLRSKGLGGVPAFASGIIPDQEIAAVNAMGILAVSDPGTSTELIVQMVRSAVDDR